MFEGMELFSQKGFGFTGRATMYSCARWATNRPRPIAAKVRFSAGLIAVIAGSPFRSSTLPQDTWAWLGRANTRAVLVGMGGVGQ